MITEIKYSCYDRLKDEQEQKVKLVKHLDNNVNTLKNSLKIIKNHSKHFNDRNIRLIKEIDRFSGIENVLEIKIFRKRIVDFIL